MICLSELQQLNQVGQKLICDFRQPRAAAQFRQRPKPTTSAGGPSQKFDYSMPSDKEPPVGYICYRCGQKGELASKHAL
jgi:protein MPE1